jgi:hypothetical protein
MCYPCDLFIPSAPSASPAARAQRAVENIAPIKVFALAVGVAPASITSADAIRQPLPHAAPRNAPGSRSLSSIDGAYCHQEPDFIRSPLI